MSKTRVCVTLYTWGTQTYSSPVDEYDRGLSHAAQTALWGGNYGHASLLLTIPDTLQNRVLVDKYLVDTGIPVEYKNYQVKTIYYYKDRPPVITDKNAYKENVIEIYFSWWPNHQDNTFSFKKYNKDCMLEREGQEFGFSDFWQDYLVPEISHTSDALLKGAGATNVTLGPAHVTHEKGFNPKEKAVLRTFQDLTHVRRQMKTLKQLYRHSLEALSDEKPKKIKQADIAIAKNMFPELKWEKMDAEQFHGKIKKKIDQLIPTMVAMLYEHAAALTKLNGVEAAVKAKKSLKSEIKMTGSQLNQYHKLLKKMKKQHIILASIAQMNTLNRMIKEEKTLSQLFPNGVTASNFQDIKDYLQFQLDPTMEGALAQHYEFLKGKRTAQINFFKSFNKIEEVKKIHALCKDSKVSPILKIGKQEDLKKKLEMHQHALIEMGIPFDSLLKMSPEQLEKKLQPFLNVRQSPYYGLFAEVMQSSNIDVFAELESEKVKQLFEQAHTRGNPPSQIAYLPIKTEGNAGLDIERMLATMRAFARQGNAFNIINNNCAVTSGEILAAGAEENGYLFEQRALNRFATPQMVYNNAVEYLSALTKPAKQKEVKKERKGAS